MHLICLEFLTLYLTHYNFKQTAEDITQETFLRYFSKHLSLDSSKELPYIYTIARNLCIEEYSKNSKELISETNDDPGYDPTEEWINSIALKELVYWQECVEF